MKNWFRQLAFLLVCPAVPALAIGILIPHPPIWSASELREGEVSLEEVLAWAPETFIWVDARAKSDFEQAHIPQALLLNEDGWSELLLANLEALTSGRRIVVYCSSEQCRASEMVAKRIRSEGLAQEVYVLKDGWEAWLKR